MPEPYADPGNSPEHPVCCVADQFCIAAANFEDRPRTLPACSRCEAPVCSKCSLSRGAKRACHDCLVSGGEGRRVAEHLASQAGYSEAPDYLLLLCDAEAT